MPKTVKVPVINVGPTQQITIPAGFHFSTTEVYLEVDSKSGALRLSEKPSMPEGPKMSWAEVFAELDAAGAGDYVFERDPLPSTERDLF